MSNEKLVEHLKEKDLVLVDITFSSGVIGVLKPSVITRMPNEEFEKEKFIANAPVERMEQRVQCELSGISQRNSKQLVERYYNSNDKHHWEIGSMIVRKSECKEK